MNSRKFLMMAISSIVAISLVLLSIGFASDKTKQDKDQGQKPGEHGLRKIQHIVYIIKENRTFDNYFGTFPGAEGATSGTISTGVVIPLGHAPDRTPRDIDHSFQAALRAMDGGKMDQFDLIGGGNVNGDYLAYTQYTEADIPNYFAYASHFTLGDHMFSSLHGPSFPNHLYTVGAQSGGAIKNPTSVDFQSRPCITAFSCWTVQFSPTHTLAGGCSLLSALTTSQLTAGNFPFAASSTNWAVDTT